MGDTALVGIKSVEDLRNYRFASAAEFGLDTIDRIIQRDLANINASMDDALGLLADPLIEQSRIYGTSYKHPMQEVDEHGVADSKKAQPGQTVSFPIRRFTQTLGWTNVYFGMKTPAELAEDYIAVRNGYASEVIKQIRKSAFLKDNYDFVDELTNGVTLGVKRFLNNDGSKVPDNPDGTAGDTSTHYVGRAGSAVAVADVNALVDNVTEHGNYQGLMIAVSATDAPTIQALVSGTIVPLGFIPATDGGLNQPFAVTQQFGSAAPQLGDNRRIGFWRNSSVEVWIKPWAVDSHWACFATGAPEKPLGYRRPRFAGMQGYRLLSMDERLAIRAQATEALFGLGVWNRTAGAFLDIANQTTYTDPTIT